MSLSRDGPKKAQTFYLSGLFTETKGPINRKTHAHVGSACVVQ